MAARRKDAKSRRWSRGYRSGKRVAYNALVKSSGGLYNRGEHWSKKFFGPSWKEADNDQKYHRRAMNFYGAGAYFNPNSAVAAGLRSGGAWLGRMTGVPGASEVGRWGAGQASKWLGFGAYAQPTSGNQLMMDQSQVPISVNSAGDETGDVWVTHTEFVQNVTATATAAGSTLFQQQQFALNPGLSTTFPFLSQLAQNFEMYDFHGLMFQYKPTSGESGAASNSLGKVMLAVNYDPDAGPFLNSVQLENYDYACSTKPALGLVHGVETANHQQAVNMMYVRTGTSNKDKVFTDLGTLTVATEGVPASGAGTQIIGELWVTYSIRLSRANLYNSILGLGIPADYFYGAVTAASLTSTIVPQTTNAGLWSVVPSTTAATQITLQCNNLNLTLGCFQVSVFIVTTVPPATTVQWGAITKTNVQDIANIAGNAFFYGNKATGELSMSLTYPFKIASTNPTVAPKIVINTTAALDSSFIYRVLVTQIPCNLDGVLV